MKLHRILFYILLFSVPLQTRILFHADQAYNEWYFNYHLAIFLYLTDILVITLFFAWIIFDRPKISQFFDKRLILICIGYICIALVGLLHVKQITLGWYEVVKWSEILFLISYIYMSFKDRIEITISAAILFISAVLQAGLAWTQFHMQHMLGLSWLGEYISVDGTWGLATIDTVSGKLIRSYGTMPHPNVLGGFLVLGFVLGLILVSHATKLRDKIFVGLGTTIILVGMFTTSSRTAWLATIIALIAFGIFNLVKKQFKNLFPIIAAGLLALAIIGIFYSSSLNSRVNNSDQRSVSDRYFFNNQGLDLAKHFPLLGVGAGNYVVALQEIKQFQPWQYQPPHNIFIFIAAELGFLALGLFLMLLYEIFSSLKNIQWDVLSFGLVLIGILFLLMGQLDHYFVTIQQGRLMFALALGLIAAIPNIYDKKVS